MGVGQSEGGQPFLASLGRPGSGQLVTLANPPKAEIIALQPPWQPPPPAELTTMAYWGTLLSLRPLPRLNELFVGMSGEGKGGRAWGAHTQWGFRPF